MTEELDVAPNEPAEKIHTVVYNVNNDVSLPLFELKVQEKPLDLLTMAKDIHEILPKVLAELQSLKKLLGAKEPAKKVVKIKK